MEKLPENVLEKIAGYLEVKNKLNLMLVSKRLYNLIAQNPKLCEDFHLVLRDGCYDPEIRDCSRYFSSVVFSKFNFNKENFAVVLELFSKIGKYVKTIQFFYGTIERQMLYQLFRTTPQIEKIFITFLKMRNFEGEETFQRIAHKFTKLKELFLDCGFGSVYTHLFQDTVNVVDLTVYHSFEILCNKPKLKKLRIGSNDQIDFEMILDNVEFQLTELKTDNFNVKPGTSFINFLNMIKTQQQIRSFSFGYSDEPIEEFNEVLVHILNLKSLETFETGITEVFKYLPSYSIRNHNVKQLLIDRGMYFETNIVQHFLKLFPSLKFLKIHPYSLMNANLLLINNIKSLEELSIVSVIDGHLSRDTLESLKIENLKKLHWVGYPLEHYTPENFEKFTKNNNGISDLYLDLGMWIGTDALEAIVSNLPYLRSLVITGLHSNVFDLEDRIFELIGDHCKLLEYLELDIQDKHDFEEFLAKAVEYLSKTNPEMRCRFGRVYRDDHS